MAAWLKVVIAVVVIGAIGAIGYFGASGELFQGKSVNTERVSERAEVVKRMETEKPLIPVIKIDKERDIEVFVKDDTERNPEVIVKDEELQAPAVLLPKEFKVQLSSTSELIYGFGNTPENSDLMAAFSVDASEAASNYVDFQFGFSGCLAGTSNKPVEVLYLYTEYDYTRNTFQPSVDYIARDTNRDGMFSASEFNNTAGINIPGDFVVTMRTTGHCTFDTNIPDIGTVDFINPIENNTTDRRIIFG